MNQKIIKEGVVTSSPKKLKGGFNLNQFVLKFLEWIGFAATVDCCTYYPTFPVLDVANIATPTEDEMTNIPIKGIFFADDGNGHWYLRIKNTVSTSIGVVTND
jgi:hypothetical protein